MEFVECFDKIIVWFNNHVKMMTFFLSTKLFDNSRLFTTRKLKKNIKIADENYFMAIYR